MTNIYHIYDSLGGWFPVSIDIIYIISILFAISVIAVKNPIISVLFLFILMLINIRVSELMNETKNSIPLVFLITLIFGNISYTLTPQETGITKVFYWDDIYNGTFINALNNWDNNLATLSHITNIGNVMYSTYAIWLILVSIILLLAMVGAIVINIKQKTLTNEN